MFIEDSKHVALAKFDRAIISQQQEQHFEEGDLHSFYPFDDKLFNRRVPSPPVGDFRRVYLDSHLKPEDSPMINALTPKVPPEYTRLRRVKSILKKEAHIYWIAYLQKKLMQQERHSMVELKNQGDDKYSMDFNLVIKKRVNRYANECADARREQLMR